MLHFATEMFQMSWNEGGGEGGEVGNLLKALKNQGGGLNYFFPIPS